MVELLIRLKNATSNPWRVLDLGTDSSGRTIYMNARMKAAFDAASDVLGFEPTVTQGAYMLRNGGGAGASAGYHDRGGCIDLRTWDIPEHHATVADVVAAFRAVGWAAWLRDAAHGGMDPHIHCVLLDDKKAASGAKYQMGDYRAGYDGLSPHSGDYHPRPNPIPTFDYRRWLKEQAVTEDRIIAAVREEGKKTRETVNARAKGVRGLVAEARKDIDGLPDDPATATQVASIRKRLDAIEAALVTPEETP